MRDYQWLEALRRQQGLTQAEVARRAKIDRTYYNKIERGKAPSVRVAMRIADALGFRWTLFFESRCALSTQIRRTSRSVGRMSTTRGEYETEDVRTNGGAEPDILSGGGAGGLHLR